MIISGNYCRRIKDWVSAQIAVHKAAVDAHHAKYTNDEAVNAVDAADNYLKNDESDEATLDLVIVQPTETNTRLKGITVEKGSGFMIFGNNTSNITNFMPAFLGKPNAGFNNSGLTMRGYQADVATPTFGCFILQAANKTGNGAVSATSIAIEIKNYAISLVKWLGDGTMDLIDHVIKNPKNHAYSALSGTKKLVEIKIGDVSYYFEVYPTKA